MSRVSILVRKARDNAGITFRMPKPFIPVDCHIPETAKNAMARQLYEAKIISRDDYEKMLGVVYDGDFKSNEEDFSDETFQTSYEFEQSSLATYEDFRDIDSTIEIGSDSKGEEVVSEGDRTSTNTDVQQSVEVAPNEQESKS